MYFQTFFIKHLKMFFPGFEVAELHPRELTYSPKSSIEKSNVGLVMFSC